MEFITSIKTGANLTTGAASVAVAIPTDSAGNVPRLIRVSATAAAHVALGPVGRTALVTDLMVMPSDAITLSVPRGFTHVCAIQDTATGTVNIAPLENS